MATTLDAEPKAVSPYETQVDEQIAQATSRIRVHDFAVGALVLASLVAVYAIGMIVADKSLALPESARQLCLAGFLVVLGVVAYFVLVRPLRRKVNPLYAALQVEKTIEDAKNSVAGYVELKERELNPHVRTALGARAALAVGEADLNRAVNHRSLVYLGTALAAALCTLIVLFFLFRPAQFLSLLGRAFNPFTPSAIATRTQVRLLQPETGDTTVTVGQPVPVTVHVTGRVPNPANPDRARVLIRYNPTDPNYEEVPLEKGADKHEWTTLIRSHLVQNGFWYKVAAGDAETAEHRVTVRTVPQFVGFEAQYEYPAYLRMKPEFVPDSRSPDLFGYRGTKVILTARANRDVREGRMDVLPQGGDPISVAGERIAGRPDALRFTLTLQEAGTFKLAFVSTQDERNPETSPYRIDLISDQAPSISILAPKDENTALPANGQLAVDAAIADDFGIAQATLRMRVAGEKPKPLAARPFNGGKSFRRENDGTFPKTVDYKDSVELTKLADEAGKPVNLTEGAVIEYWLEAADNQEPKPNVGKSRVQRVTLGPAVTEKDQLDQQKGERAAQEQANRQAQQKRLDGERRDPNAGPRQRPENAPQDGKAAEPAAKEPAAKPQGEPGEKAPDAKPEAGAPPKNGENPNGANEPKPAGDAGKPMGEKAETNPGNAQEPGGEGNADKKNEQQIRDEAQKVQDAIENEAKSGGDAKPNNKPEAGQRAEPAGQKPTPDEKTEKPAEPKDGGSAANGANDPKGGGKGASESKPEGELQQPPPASTEKAGPKSEAGEKPPTNPGDKPSENASDSKPEPFGSNPGEDKPAPDAKKPEPGSGQEPKTENKDESTQGGEGKSASAKSKKDDKQAGEPKNGPDESGNAEKDAAQAAGKAKPESKPSRGEEKKSPPDDAQGQKSEPSNSEPQAGSGKPQKAPESGDHKPQPQNGSKPEEGTSDEKGPPPEGGDPAESKPEDGSGNAGKPSPGQKPTEKGSDKSSDPGELARERGRKKQEENSNAQKKQQPKDGPQELTRNKEEFNDTARDLNSKDEQTRKNAEQKMDNAVGEQGRRDAQQAARGLDSKDQNEQKKAEEELDGLRKKKKKPEATAQNGNDNKQPDAKKEPGPGNAKNDNKPTKEQIEQMAQKAKDLNSPDKETREKAEKDLDQKIGEQDRKDLQQAMKDAQSGDKGKQEAARQKLEEMAKKSQGQGSGKPEPKPTKEQVEELANTAKDLQSDDPKTREAAEKKLDDKFGKEKREQLQKAMNEAKADPKKAEEAKRKMEEMAKQAADKNAKNGEPEKDKPLSPEDQQKLAEKLQDLGSKDDKKRAEAEKAFDDKLGKEKREQLQQAMKNDKKGELDQGPTPAQLEDAKKKLEELAKKPAGGDREPRGNQPPEGASATEPKDNTAADADPKNQLKSGELQLEDFKKKQFDKEFLKTIGKNEDEYQQFLRGYEQMLERMRNETAAAEKAGRAPAPTPAPTINVGDAGKVEARTGGDGSTTNGGAAYAPPGFSNAKKRFGEEASKLKQPQK